MTTPQLRLREIRDEASALAAKGVLSDEESTKFEGLMAEANGLKAQIGHLEEFDGLKSWMDQSKGQIPMAGGDDWSPSAPPRHTGDTYIETSPGKNGGVKATLVDQYGEGILTDKQIMATTTAEYKAVFRDYLKFGDKGLNRLSNSAIKTLQEGQDAEGGFLVPADVLNTIIAKTPAPSRVAARTTQLNTSRDTLVVPRVNYTSATDDTNGFIFTTGIRSTWTGEIPSSSTAMRVTDPVFGQTRIPVYTNMMSLPASLDMVEDTSFDVTGWVSGKFSETIQLLKDQMVLKGTGRGQPSGILNSVGTDASQVSSINAGNPITGDGIISVGFALPEQYDMNAVWVFSKTQTGPVIAKLKDSQNRYLWGNGLQDSGLSPDLHNRRLLGYEVLFSEFMPGPGANNYPLLFGDLSGYFMVNRIGISVRVLNELYAETNQVLILGRVRFGGEVAEAWKMLAGKQA